MRREEFSQLLATRPVWLDGGLGSMLIAAGLPPGHGPERWNLEQPARVEAVHRAYVDAGCRVVHANTFGCSQPKLRAAGLDADVATVNRAAVAHARRAAGERAVVAGDLGPTGLSLPPLGNATVADLESAFVEQVEVLVEAGVDLLSIETMYDLREALAALAAARRHDLPVMASMTFEARKRGFFTVMGDPLAGSLATLAAAGADAVGCNCSVGPDTMVAMAAEALASVSVPVVAQPNAGLPRTTPEGVGYDAGPAEFARACAAMAAAGVALLGGCCGTTPAHLAAARAAVARQ
jgi:5-methyltetrahydrofolate--homocysteine methyltransferase